MRVLLTGAAGFIGNHTAEALLLRGDEVVGIDNFDTTYDPAIKRRNVARILNHPRFQLVDVDVRDATAMHALFAHGAFDAVVHLAAWASVRGSVSQPERYVDVNVGGTLNVLEGARRNQVGRFVFASSSSVYGLSDATLLRETDRTDQPISPYAASKKAGEVLTYTYHHLYGLNVSALRFFTVYGPRQRPEMAVHKLTRAMVQGEVIPLYGDGATARDHTYVTDIVAGTLAALDRCKGYEVYNLGRSVPVRIDDLVQHIARALGMTPTVRHEPALRGEISSTHADITKAHAQLGYAPTVEIDAGVKLFVQWFRSEEGLLT